MFEDIFEDEKNIEDDEFLGTQPVDTEMAVDDLAVVLYREGTGLPDPGGVVHIGMRVLKILEVHGDHIITVLGRIPKWAIRQYVKEATRTVHNNSEYDQNKILVFGKPPRHRDTNATK